MKKIPVIQLICLLILSAVLNTASAQDKNPPKWIDFGKRETLFPDTKFVMGFSSDKFTSYTDKTEMQKLLEENSRTALVEAIQVSIRSMATSQVVASGSEAYNSFRRTSVSISKVDLKGLKIESFFDNTMGEAYALAYANKAEISLLYRNKILTEKAQIEQYVANAEAFQKNGDKQNALKSYFTAQTHFREVEEAQALIMTFEGVTTTAEFVYFEPINVLRIKVAKGIKDLQSSKDLSLDDAAFVLGLGLKLQADSIAGEMRLVNFTFQDSKMASAFSKRLTQMMESKLVDQGMNVKVREASMADNNDKTPHAILSGTYWEEGTDIKIIALVRDGITNKTIASSESSVPKAWLDAKGIEYKPANYDNAIKNLVEFTNNETMPEGGLLVQLTTNRGNEGLIFTQNDEMKVFVRANKSCYIRLIYFLADGSKVLLFDNYFISNDQANKIIEIPETFVCTAPFGIETLQLNAQSEEFAPLKVQVEDGYSFIQEELKDVLFKTRGFKPKGNKDAKSEQRIMITTLAK